MNRMTRICYYTTHKIMRVLACPASNMEYSAADAMVCKKSLTPGIRCLSSDLTLIDDKRTFMNKCKSVGLSVPNFYF